MAKDFAAMEDSNRSSNPSIHDVSDPARRTVLRGGLGLAVTGLLAPLAGTLAGCATAGGAAPPLLGFKSVPVSTADAVTVPAGYVTQVIAAWGEPVGVAGAMPAFRFDAGNTAAEQALQLGMHHDGLHYYALDGSRRGLLVMNHEYTDDGLLHPDGMKTWSAEKVRKAQAAHGVSVIEIEWKDGRWQQVRPSRHARRITASTPCTFSGPAAGHALLRTAADPAGRVVLGTLNNCASGKTPWGTYLTCEENFVFYFKGPERPDAHQRRWGLRPGDPVGYRWHEFDERFDAAKHPNEPNRFGWVVEIDPMDPTMTPVKRTALGRAAHEGATVAVTRDGRAVVYMGEDARFEYIYKFVSRDRIRPGGFAANRELLDHGTLYVARFDADGSGRWLPLVHGQGPLTAATGFAGQGEVLVKTRQASDLLGATKMDRPEWIDVDRDGWVYCTLTNNSSRGGAGQPAVDAANPRANNTMGHIIRWKEDGDFDGTTFRWNHFVLAGDPANERADAKGNVNGDAFACPDGLWVDARGVLWIQTDMSTSAMGKGDLVRLGNNQMLAADPQTGEVRRFLVGPVGCEITGATATPDGRTMFINIQHPGETPSERSDPDQPRRISNWPDFRADGRPRSATVVIRKADGGVIGT
ncbi:PhoX family phosphatase [Calidifontimicrobium sp. SYSU G02091]|uniref:PhoX family protein n=1 Tax=Calidifontimicrobium sp. SYSU G02091 TaxID=2926421 RepID=UPI001F535C75|nr:PhoX family phosphatase [Calidifontimicrobium sp. SYSU G02091]MCI1191665.1 PhoX family phosphatase [Calidifontimicrobium sp. SYSU G02091]